MNTGTARWDLPTQSKAPATLLFPEFPAESIPSKDEASFLTVTLVVNGGLQIK